MVEKASKNAQILIVDDDPLTRYSLKEMMSLEGYTVRAAEDAETAMAMLNESPSDVVITDISMPGLSGFDLLKSVTS
jgi:two-component system C4-dicarboxylate transport response regulator DctD